MIIRLLPRDAEKYRSIRLAALLESPTSFGSTYEHAMSMKIHEWQHRLQSDTMPIFAFETCGTIKGIIGGIVNEKSDFGELVGMWVAPECRGFGVSDELVVTIIEWMRARNCRRIVLEVTEGNVRAENLYSRHGFVRNGSQEVRQRDGMIEFQMEFDFVRNLAD